MNTTRKTILAARAVAAISAVTAYFCMGALYDLMLLAGSGRTVAAALGISVAVICADIYHRVFTDYRVRLAYLGAAYGVSVATLAMLTVPLFR